MRVIIVDDEIVFRVGIKNILDWEAQGFELIGEADNGNDALGLIAREQPDLIMTGIKMPGMDGLELIRNVKKSFPSIKFVVLSDHSDLEFISEAMAIGACSYLLKFKIDRDMLLETLKNIHIEIQQAKAANTHLENSVQDSSLKASLKKNISLLRRKLLRDYLLKEESSDEILHELQELLQINVKNKYICCLYFGMEHMEKYPDKDIVIDVVESVVAAQYFGHCFRAAQEEYGILLSFDSLPTIDELKKTSNQLTEAIYMHLRAIIKVGIGIEANSITAMRHSYDTALTAYMLGKIDNLSVACYKELSHLRCLNELSTQFCTNNKSFLELIEKAFSLRDLTELRRVALRTERLLPAREGVEKFIQFGIRFYIDVIRFFEKNGADVHAQLKSGNRSILQISEISSVKEVGTWLDALYEDLNLYMIDNYLNEHVPQAIKIAVRYVGRNYYQGLSAQDVAKVVELSPTYFSNLFVQYVGMNFKQYLTQVRIQKAKNLLINTNLKVYEISYQVGYSNSFYFNRVFKKNTGATPSEFRNTYVVD